MTSEPLLIATDLRKFYGPRLALRGLTFSLQAGHILGFLGPNGAGKTTAIRILTTIMAPDGGSFSVNGIPSEKPDEIRRKIGVLPENLGFPKQMTGLEYLSYYGQLFGQSAADARTRSQTLLKEVGMEQRAKSLIGSYSHGMRQRLGIARALINDPSVLFLDEPTLGLDPRGQTELLDLIQRIARERNVGVILCSHALSEIEGVCDDVVILSAGQIIASGPVAEVVGKTQRNGIRVRVPLESISTATKALQAVQTVTKASAENDSTGWLSVEVLDMADGLANNKLLEALIRAEIPVLGYETSSGGRLQDVFLQLTQEAIR
jgi:ABC-2 type transport system ATP-binding protein